MAGGDLTDENDEYEDGPEIEHTFDGSWLKYINGG